MGRKVVIETKDCFTEILNVDYISFDKKFIVVKSDTSTQYFSYRVVVNITDIKEQA